MSKLSKILRKVGEHAPIIGSLLGGGGPAVSGAMGIIRSVLGAKDDADAEARLAQDPQAFVRLKEYEMRHKAELEELQLAETKAYLSDTKSARRREIEFVKATGGRDWFQATIGILVVAAFIGTLVVSFTRPVPAGSDRIVGALIGILGTLTIQVVNYLYGTSKSSAEKTALMNQQFKKGSE